MRIQQKKNARSFKLMRAMPIRLRGLIAIPILPALLILMVLSAMHKASVKFGYVLIGELEDGWPTWKSLAEYVVRAFFFGKES